MAIFLKMQGERHRFSIGWQVEVAGEMVRDIARYAYGDIDF